MTSHCFAKKIFIFFTLIFFPLIFSHSLSQLHAEIIQDDDFGFSLDIPEGFAIDDYSEDGMSYLFSHPNIPVSFLMKIINSENAKGSAEVLEENLNKLRAEKSIDTFKWNESICAISQFSMTLDKAYGGWAAVSPLPLAKNSYIVLISYSPAEQKDACSQFMISLINSLCVDTKYYNKPGIVMAYAFPDEGKKRLQLNVSGTKVNTSIDKVSEEAAQFFIDLEFSVFKLYANHKLWKEAWQRYYRMIYRDNYGRIEGCIKDITQRLIEEAEAAGSTDVNLYTAQKLLSWVQDFSYTRKNTSASESDFTSLPEALCGGGNDCDSRSMLICACMRYLGIESVLLISRDYSHAMTAVELDAPGQKFIPENSEIELLMGETTAKVTWGMIAQDMADRTKWIPVYLP